MVVCTANLLAHYVVGLWILRRWKSLCDRMTKCHATLHLLMNDFQWPAKHHWTNIEVINGVVSFYYHQVDSPQSFSWPNQLISEFHILYSLTILKAFAFASLQSFHPFFTMIWMFLMAFKRLSSILLLVVPSSVKFGHEPLQCTAMSVSFASILNT